MYEEDHGRDALRLPYALQKRKEEKKKHLKANQWPIIKVNRPDRFHHNDDG